MAKKIPFEKSLQRLDEIVRLLESGEADLEGSLKLFSEGAALLSECRSTLDAAELTIEKLFPSAKGENDD